MIERDPDAKEVRLVRPLFLGIGNTCLGGSGGVEGGVGTIGLIFARVGKGKAKGDASRGAGVGVVDLASSSTSMGISSFALLL